MELVTLSPHDLLYRPPGVIREVFFPLTAVLVLSEETSEGHVVEIGQVGREGIAGVEVALRTQWCGKALVRTGIQIPGTALRMRAEHFAEEVDASLSVNRCVRRYMGFFFAQLQVLVACSRHHSLEQRGARWLLALQDRAGARELRVTQQHLADMLGVARQSADRWLGELHEAGIIDRRRAVLTIGDRSRLLARTCDCYHAIAERLASIGTGRG